MSDAADRPSDSRDATTPAPRSTLLELAALFGRLGSTAFGGPAVHIAMMEDEVVRRRRWLTSQEFLDLLGATNLIPGPNSTELAIHVGHRRAGFPGLVVAGAAFILPSALIVGVLAWGYVRFGQVPAAGGLLRGVKPVVVAIVFQALVGFGRTALRTPLQWAVGSAALAACAAGANELLLLLVSGATVMWVRTRSRSATALVVPLVPGTLLQGTLAAGASAFSLAQLFLVFAKIGSVLFGSGYVLLAFLRADLVQHRGWLSESQLLDAVAVGQVTPGPVLTTATFVGYVLAGWRGAAVATLGMFLPAFAFVAASGPLVPRLRRSRAAGAFLDGVNVASLALMTVVSAQMARAAVADVTTAALAAVSAALLLGRRVNSSWLVLAGAAVGLAFLG